MSTDNIYHCHCGTLTQTLRNKDFSFMEILADLNQRKPKLTFLALADLISTGSVCRLLSILADDHQ